MVLPLSVLPLKGASDWIAQSRRLRRYFGRPYLIFNTWIWNHLPPSLRSLPPIRGYGSHLHRLFRLRERAQSTGTFFFRNRPELELLIRLLEGIRPGSTIDMAILGCSKGAEVYSFSYAIRTKRPDLNIRICALDISEDTLEFAEAGVYSLNAEEGLSEKKIGLTGADGHVAVMTSKDQPSSIFERMSQMEMEAMFESEGRQVRVKPRFRDAIKWRFGDANEPDLPIALGLQDIVVANRFLCHMDPDEAEFCLRNLARLVKGDGYLFVSGVDLEVRSKVAQELGWRPVTELIQEIHEGDPSLTRGWPLQYWGLEPFTQSRDDWKIRFASVFQMPGRPRSEVSADRSPIAAITRDA